MAYTVSMISLGCAKNQVNAEQMLFRLQEAGYQISGAPEGTDLVIINTCGFIDSAKEEAISHILQMAQLKEAGLVGKIMVTGCLAQRYQSEILQEMPEVDGVLGTGSYYNIAAAVHQVLEGNTVEEYGDINAPVDETGRILTTPDHYAYLTIAEGCDNKCSYCVIPKLRGKYRSRTMDDILYEARTLAANGVKELIVVAQDTSRYGMDLEGRHMLPDLLHGLCAIEGIHWIRIHYLYPEDMTDEIIDAIASEPKIVKYLDIPIQHINDLILKRMNRRGTKAYLEALFRKIRERIPGVVLRTSLITGLPYEDEAAFEELCEFLKEFRLERVGAFVFSPQEGTAAAKMEYPPREIAEQRAACIENLQATIMDEFTLGLIGETLEVLCEGYSAETELYFGRSFADSPDIDGRVWFTSDRDVAPGTFVPVFIGEMQDGDPIGAAVWGELTMTLANKITFVRFLLIPVFMVLLLLHCEIASFAVFVIASITDFIDGYIARTYNQITDFGKFMDPLADKLLVVSCMVIFTEWGRFPSWALMLVLAREFGVTGLRLVAVESGLVIAAAWSGKIKTAATMIGLCVMLVFSIPVLDLLIVLLIVLTTVISGVEYFVKNWDILSLPKHRKA